MLSFKSLYYFSEFERFKMNLTSIWSSRCDERSLLRELYQILPVSFHFIIPRIEPGINAAIMTLNQIQFPGCYGVLYLLSKFYQQVHSL